MLDLKEEQKYTELKELAGELHIPMPKVFWTLEVFDKGGKLIQRHHQRSHSWVRNAYNLMFCMLACHPAPDGGFGAGFLNIKDTGGVVRSNATRILAVAYGLTNPINEPDVYGMLALAGEDNHGILVGSGTNAESFEDFALQTQIVNGTGAGELSHIASELHDISYAGLTLTDDQVRFFNNNSGGNVNVNEVIIVDRGYVGGAGYNWANARDKLGATVTVPDTGQLKVTYTIELTYPS